jgi:hypothetical protein
MLPGAKDLDGFFETTPEQQQKMDTRMELAQDMDY